MTVEEITKKVIELLNANTKEACEEVLSLLEDQNKAFLEKKDRKALELFETRAKIGLETISLAALPEDDKKNKIHLQGKLIKLYGKLEKLELAPNLKNEARFKKDTLLKEQAALSKNYRKTADDIPILERAALKLKEIGNTIKAFVDEKDIITKVTNIVKETVKGSLYSGALIAGIGLITSSIVGLPFSLSTLSTIVPVIAYTGLSSFISNISRKTNYQEYVYYQSEEYKKYVEEFKEQNKDKLEMVKKLIAAKEGAKGVEEKLEINDSLITLFDELGKNTKEKGLKDGYGLEALGLVRENKKLCEEVTEKYLNEENDDKGKFQEYQKKIRGYNLQIFARENSFGEALKHGGKVALENAGVMILAKAIVTAIFPESQIAIHGFRSLVLPIALAITNGIIDVSTYAGKLKYKETSENIEISPEDKERFLDLFKNQKLAIA